MALKWQLSRLLFDTEDIEQIQAVLVGNSGFQGTEAAYWSLSDQSISETLFTRMAQIPLRYYTTVMFYDFNYHLQLTASDDLRTIDEDFDTYLLENTGLSWKLGKLERTQTD